MREIGGRRGNEKKEIVRDIKCRERKTSRYLDRQSDRQTRRKKETEKRTT